MHRALLLLSLVGAVSAAEPSSLLTLDEARPIAEAAAWGELAWSPDASRISALGEGGLWILPLEGGEPQPAPALWPAVFRHGWASEPERLRVGPRGDKPEVAVELATGRSVSPGWEPSEPRALARRDDIWLVAEGEERRLTQGEDRFFDPVVSPDGRWLAFSGLVTGLHVMDLQSGRLWHLGSGRWPSWHPDGDWLAFERNTDDGLRLTGAELLLWHPTLGAPLALTDDAGSQDRFPTFSPDGGQLAWVRDGAVWVARVVEVTP